MIIYYLVCCVMAFIAFRNASARLLKWASAIIGVAFLSQVAGNTIGNSFGAFAHLFTFVAGVVFIAAVARHRSLEKSERLLLILFAIIIMFRSCFRILHLNGADEMSLLSLVLVAATALWFLGKTFFKKSLKGKTDVLEVAGLFAWFVMPSVIELFF